MISKHKFDLKKQGILRKTSGGQRLLASSKKLPFFKHMALAEIILNEKGVREPHWHPNANEMTYCQNGKALVTIFSPNNIRTTFTLSEGEIFHIPKGYIHHIENIHRGKSRFILCYDHDAPEDLDLSESVGSMTAQTLASTFGSSRSVFEKIKKKAKDQFIVKRKTGLTPLPASIPNPYKFDLESINPQIETKGGSARIANVHNFSALKDLALFSLRIAPKGVREPHWHPNATELNYVLKGKARLTIFSPGGEKDTFEVGAGQGSMIPPGYFHYIENIGAGEMHMSVFFNNKEPDDIGLSGAFSVYSEEVLAALFSLEPKFFRQIQKFAVDRMIVTGGG